MPLRHDPSAVTLVEPHAEAYSNPADDQAEEIEERRSRESRSRRASASSRPRVPPPSAARTATSSPRSRCSPRRRASDRATLSDEAIQENAKALESVLGDFGVRGEIINAHPGPVVTLYELEPAPGIKSSRVIGLSDDIARSMSKVSARVAVVPGRNAIGIELPNPKREKVLLREMLSSSDYTDTPGEAAALPRQDHRRRSGDRRSRAHAASAHRRHHRLGQVGRDQHDDPEPDVPAAPGATAALIMIDPKMLELSVYDGIPHLLTPVVTDPKKAVVALKWAVREMEERYRKMSKLGVRNIDGYNARVTEAKQKGEALSPHGAHRLRQGIRRRDLREGRPRARQHPLHRGHRRRDGRPDDGRRQGHRRRDAAPRPDGARRRHPRRSSRRSALRSTSSPAPSRRISRPASRSRSPRRSTAARSSASRAPSNCSVRATCSTWRAAGASAACTGRSVSDEEVEKIVRHLKSQGTPQYLEAVTVSDEPEEGEGEDGAVFDNSAMGKTNDLYSQAVAIVMRDRKASTSYIQRRLQIGYNRAASLMEKMELEGIVGAGQPCRKARDSRRRTRTRARIECDSCRRLAGSRCRQRAAKSPQPGD